MPAEAVSTDGHRYDSSRAVDAIPASGVSQLVIPRLFWGRGALSMV